jgi:hypothetical protein
MPKSIQMRPKSQKKNKKIYETFKGSSRVSRGRTFFYETFFKFRTGEKGYTKPSEFHITSYELLGFSTKPLGCNMKL